MGRSTPTVADVFRRYGDAYRADASASLSTAQRRVMTAIARCRTAALGGHIEQCDQCGHTRVWYHSCLMESVSFWGADGERGVRTEAPRPFDSPLPRGLEPGEQGVRWSERALAQAGRHDGLDRLQLLAGIGADVHLGGG